ncbi:thioesterase [Parafrankia colletiae]|uniref:Thioesterase n=1 Tax=Parafrankia colletiae TaxID=573497 RepID=A0A1S1QGR4_9ACTN|nr:alpha/beta fold hydrolase [Parafrankia colletiae]MCK9902335.1 alpha/beta fold hydrolase [Frankia sp. Cpl3]OHV33150.1 thioesterase [Parafrankia colletiae]
MSPRPRWFQPAEIDPEAAVRLFCLPHAGGGASTFHGWAEYLPADVAMQAVQLPGRQDRLSEPPFTRPEPLVDALYEALMDELDDRPYALFGHSLGALLAYRLAVAIDRYGGPPPVLVGAAGWTPRGFLVPPKDKIDAPQQELVDWLISLGSLPPEIYTDERMLAITMPPTRADLTVCAYLVDDGARVPCPLVTYTGRADTLMSEGAVSSWLGRGTSYLGNREFPGGHFFVDDCGLAIALDLVSHLRHYLAPAR